MFSITEEKCANIKHGEFIDYDFSCTGNSIVSLLSACLRTLTHRTPETVRFTSQYSSFFICILEERTVVVTGILTPEARPIMLPIEDFAAEVVTDIEREGAEAWAELMAFEAKDIPALEEEIVEIKNELVKALENRKTA